MYSHSFQTLRNVQSAAAYNSALVPAINDYEFKTRFCSATFSLLICLSLLGAIADPLLRYSTKLFYLEASCSEAPS